MVIARNTKLSRNIPVGNMLIRVKNQGCGLKGRWQGAKNSTDFADFRLQTFDFGMG